MRLLGAKPPLADAKQDEGRRRLLDQERRVAALDRAVEVIQRDIPEGGHAH